MRHSPPPPVPAKQALRAARSAQLHRGVQVTACEASGRGRGRSSAWAGPGPAGAGMHARPSRRQTLRGPAGTPAAGCGRRRAPSQNSISRMPLGPSRLTPLKPTTLGCRSSCRRKASCAWAGQLAVWDGAYQGAWPWAQQAPNCTGANGGGRAPRAASQRPAGGVTRPACHGPGAPAAAAAQRRRAGAGRRTVTNASCASAEHPMSISLAATTSLRYRALYTTPLQSEHEK